MSEQDVRDALAFEEQQQVAAAKRPPIWLSLFASAAYGVWFAYMWIKDDVHPIVPISGLVLVLGVFLYRLST
ncbi:putative membrane protein [Corynebacterium aurimucosum ATCC 700975]|uniref:Putative membrane protein n=2 Tax=Corynebacterium aurimucosum TaxID=169292 RepID=C3PFW3_CORA7|nr:putative membrane protein [Corynebacterium aurimucosum ATCC 700975]